MELDNTLIVSGIFGKRFTKTYKAPLGKNCIFFTNNESLKDEIVNNGWMYIYIDFELTDDYIVSSLQSKYIKFLIFLEKYPEFKHFSNIIHTDHKFQLLDSHIQKLQNIYNSDNTKLIVIRKTHTGIICYNNFSQIIPMLNDIYNTCIELQQPECQVFWAVYCQKYVEYIKQIEFDEVNPLWKEP